jgi:hypothetical protein
VKDTEGTLKHTEYWCNKEQFDLGSMLLTKLSELNAAAYIPGGPAKVSGRTLADLQREMRIGCIYLWGGRIDNLFGVASGTVALLHSGLPTDYSKAIAPAYHAFHDEWITVTTGQVVIEFSRSISSDAKLESQTLVPGSLFHVPKGWPHRISLAPLRAVSRIHDGLVSLSYSRAEQVKASFLALKIGMLGEKSDLETMTKWEGSHPLIGAWLDDQSFLRSVMANEENCSLLYLPK